ncbi:MAG: hypothetical protein ABIJ34_02365 [archaeon]|nr:hypothetical protein [Candidatus Micrarchaeota archaeon]MBU1887028.1 hypothetical protein [Candidatus Micrarchaeota archaeon]
MNSDQDTRLKKSIRNVKIFDCTLRDGGHLNNWQFDKEFAAKVVAALAETNIHCIEVGYRSTPGTFPGTGTWRFSKEDDIRAIVPADIQSKIAVMGDVGKIRKDDFLPKEESVVDIVRLAFYPGHEEEAVELGHELLDMGYEVYLNMMGIVCYTEDGLKKLINTMYDCRVPNVVVSDSFGSLMPSEVYELVQLFIKGTGKKIGYHAHNNLEMAFANSMSAIDAGASSIDATVYGMGRGAGNLPLEVILSHLYHIEEVPVNIVPLLELIENDFIKLRKELNWGYNLHYMISGLLKCHPKYANALLDDYKMDMPTVWANLMELSKEKPVSFDKQLLENVVQKNGSVKAHVMRRDVKYSDIKIERETPKPPDYIGRHAGKDFLILGNGPSLKDNIDEIKKFAKDNELIMLGANYLSGLATPDYHAFNNVNRFIRYGKFVDAKSKLLVGSYISNSIVKSVIGKEYERLPYMNSPEKFDIKDGIIQSNCGTISVLLIGTAIVMGAKKIYVAGLDGYKDMYGKKSTFYSETQDVPTILESHSLNSLCERYLDEITEYQKQNSMEPFKIITKTSYFEYYVGGIL